ncbi:MAG TPA: hypothetical protein VN894_16215 [Polyangiaceae bacterium]|nr:hypothetical protein [Polyangiaceae bacterium]
MILEVNPKRPLWQRASVNRHNRGARARITLWRLLQRCGQYEVTLVTVHQWSREMQGAAYLWGIDRLDGIENVPAPWMGP